jgi:hypothetical protein
MTEATPDAQPAFNPAAPPAKTAITMVLDRSGSMDACRNAAINSVNAYLQKNRADDKLKDADFELAIFDTQAYDVIRRGALSAAHDITAADYIPRDGTPLLDAVGRGIDGLDKRALDDAAVLVIVTDGLENSSRKHTYASIKALLEERQQKGWLVLFLGAGLESAQEGLRMGVPNVNVANIGLDEVYLRASMDAISDTHAVYAAQSSPAQRRNYSASRKFSSVERACMGDPTGGKDIETDDGEAKTTLEKLFGRNKKTAPKAPPAAAPPSDAWSQGQDDAWR